MLNPNNKYLHHLGLITYTATITLTAILFIHSLFTGGITIDESTAPRMVAVHLAVAANNLTLEQVPNDFIYYGIVNILPGYLINSLLSTTFGNYYYICSHISIFLMGLLTSYLVYKILKLCKINSNTAYLSSALLLLYPCWLGHSFFNFKDIPTAFFYTLYSYCVCMTISALSSRNRKVPTVKLVISGALFASVKLALFPVVIIYTCIIVIATQNRSSQPIHLDTPSKTKFKNITKNSKSIKNKLNTLDLKNQAAINFKNSSAKFAFNRLLSVHNIKFTTLILFSTLLLVYILTPGAWHQPLTYSYNELIMMSKFPWSGCSKLLGECFNPSLPSWNSGKYLLSWYLMQIPILYLLLFIIGVYTSLKSSHLDKSIRWYIVVVFLQLLLLPSLIVLHNSTLYDGSRHTLFCIPVIVIIMGFGLQFVCTTILKLINNYVRILIISIIIIIYVSFNSR